MFGLFLNAPCILVTNSHLTPERLISAVGDLTMSSLAHTARLLDWQRPTLVAGMKISFIVLFYSSWVEGLLVLGCCHSLCYIKNIPRLSGIS